VRLGALRRAIPPLLRETPDFRRLWLGSTISVFGDQITQLGLPLVAVLTLGADATQMGTLTAVGLLPHLLFSLPAGVWLDRIRKRRRLMITADLARAVLIASIPVAFALHVLGLPQLFVVGFATGTLSVVFDLSWNTLFVTVTERERYVEAMALLNGSRSLASVGGPTIGGLLVQVLGAPLAMLSDAMSFLGSVVFLRRIRSPEPPVEPEAGSIREQLMVGLSFVFRDGVMRGVLLSVAASVILRVRPIIDAALGPHFLRAGIGYGGSCFPKDSLALKQLASNSGYHFHLLSAVIEVNELQKRRVVQKLQKHLGKLRGKKIALLGLAFKAGTDDMREAPSLVLASRLLAEGAEVRAWDPVARPGELMKGAVLVDSVLDAVRDADAAVIVTEWDELRGLASKEVHDAMARPLILDGRNLLDPAETRAADFAYEGIGRPTSPFEALPETPEPETKVKN